MNTLKKSNPNFLNATDKRFDPKIGYMFIALIMLEFMLIPWIPNSQFPRAARDLYANLSWLYITLSYTLIFIGTLIFQAKSRVFILDQFTIGLIVITCFIRPRIPVINGGFEAIGRFYMSLLGVAFLVNWVMNRDKMKIPGFHSILYGVLWAAGTVILLSMMKLFLEIGNLTSLPGDIKSYLVNALLFQVIMVTVIEEACFRGLVTNLLINNGFQENRAYFIQAIFF